MLIRFYSAKKCRNFKLYVELKTLAKIPNKGKITFDNTEFEVEKMTKKDILDIRKYTTMVFQNYNLFKNKTALNNIIEGLLVVKKMNKEEAEKIGLELLKKVCSVLKSL